MKKISGAIIWIFAFIIFFPLVVLVLWAFAKRWPWPGIFPAEYSLRAILYVLKGSHSINILISSILLSLAVTITALAVSIPAAKALGLYEFRGKGFFKILVLLPLMISPVATALGIQVFFIRLGLAGTFLGVVLVHLVPCLPYGIRILSDVFEALGEDMELQARNLGAGRIQRFVYVTLPLISPGLLSAGTMIFIVSFSQYFLTFIIGGGNVVTFTMLMFPFIQSGDRAIASGFSLAFILSAFLLLCLVEGRVKTRYLAEKNFYV